MKISYKVLFAAVLATAGTNAFAADVSGLATTNYVKGAIGSLSDVARTGSYADLSGAPTLGTLAEKNAVTSADITDGTITNADVANNAAIAVSKISGAQTTANIIAKSVKADTDPEKFSSIELSDETKYPSMKAAHEIAIQVTTNKLLDVQETIDGLDTQLADLAKVVQENNEVLGDLATKDTVATADIDDGAVTGKKIADGAIVGSGNVTVSQNATTGVITVSGSQYSLPSANGTTLGGVKTGGDMTATNGDLTITDGKVTAAKLASNSVTNAKIADDAVTTAKIKGYGTGECSGTNCALVDLGAGAVWLPIVNEYSGS